MNSSWKTTLFGILAACGSGIFGAYEIDKSAMAHFPGWLPGLGVLMMSLGTAGMGFSARDNNKTSEQVRAGGQNSSQSTFRFLLLFCMAFIIIAALAACSTPKRTAYNVVKAPAVAAQEVLSGWDSYVGHQKDIGKPVPVDQLLAVRDAYRTYQRAELLAVDAAMIVAQLPPGTNSAALAAQVDAETARVKAEQEAATAYSDLVTLVRTYSTR